MDQSIQPYSLHGHFMFAMKLYAPARRKTNARPHSIRLALGESPSELPDILTPEEDRHTQQTKYPSQCTKSTEGTIIPMILHKRISPIARPKRDKPPETHR